MFGIKTKKDKRIEYLESQLFAERLKHPRVIACEKNTVTWGATVELKEHMPIDYAKNVMAEKMMKEIVKAIHYDIEDDATGRHLLKGYIRVVMD